MPVQAKFILLLNTRPIWSDDLQLKYVEIEILKVTGHILKSLLP